MTKAEQAARDAVADFIANPWHSEFERRAWHAVQKVAGCDGWWHKATACVWFATVPMGGGCGPLVAVALGAQIDHAELRVRMGHDPKPPDSDDGKFRGSLDREQLRLAAARVKYHEAITPDVQRRLRTLRQSLDFLTEEIGRSELPDLDLESVR